MAELAGARLAEALLFDSGPQDPYPYAAGLALTLALALAASLTPAMRAARVDPVRSLRAER